MRIGRYCRGEPDFLLLPTEHLSPTGPAPDLAAFLERESGWSRARVDLLATSLDLYWRRAKALADRMPAWPRPRIRGIGVASDGITLRPYAQVLNTSTWTLYDCDLDPELSHSELVAFLLVVGDWMSATGEVTQAPMRAAAWWLAAGETACASFAAAAERSVRPDAEAARAVAEALPWLRRLHHRGLQPAPAGAVHREIPGTGLEVPTDFESRPPQLVEACRRAADTALEAYRAAWRSSDAGAVAALTEWLARDQPMVMVTVASGAVVWDRVDSEATSTVRSVLENADAVAIESLRADLQRIDEHSRRFVAALSDPEALPTVDRGLSENGYAYMVPNRHMIAYNLEEPGMERLSGPALPYARAMLGARVFHEWAHLADEAGWVPAIVDERELARRGAALAASLETAVAECSPRLREPSSRDLEEIRGGRPVGEALAELLLARLPDYRANLVAGRFMSESERETYARHNVRTLRYEYPAARLWRLLIRYLYEYQYLLPHLGLTVIDDAYGYFAACTAFDADFVATGALTEERFHEITAALSQVCEAYAVDTGRIALPVS